MIVPCLVVGASGDIGSAVATRLAGTGTMVVMTRSGGPLPPDREAPDGGHWYDMDVRDSAAVTATVRAICTELGTAPNLVYCCGRIEDAPIALCSDAAWQKVIDVNLTGAFYVLRALARDLMVSGDRRIVLVGSLSARLASPGQANYSAAKAGLEALARTAAVEFGRYHVNVNVVAAGAVESRMVRGTKGSVVERIIENTPLRRLGSVDEVAAVVQSLLGDAGAYITGQSIVVDGGLSIC